LTVSGTTRCPALIVAAVATRNRPTRPAPRTGRRGAGGLTAPVAGQDDVGIEHRHQAGQVTPGGRAEERAHRVPVLRGADRHPRCPGPDVRAGAGGQLADRGRPAPHHPGYIRERDPEQVVQDPGGALGRGQRLQHHHQGVADALVERHPVSRVGQLGRAVRASRARQPLDEGLGQPRADVGLALDPGRSQDVQGAA
jgi:hypothetical protein